MARHARSLICGILEIRLDQTGVIALDVADQRADGPGGHPFQEIRREHRLEPARVGKFLPERGGPRLRTEDHRLASSLQPLVNDPTFGLWTLT